jgi:hypothetical protein
MTDWLEGAQAAVDEFASRGNTWHERLEYWDDLAAYCAANAQGLREDHSIDPPVWLDGDEAAWDDWEDE